MKILECFRTIIDYFSEPEISVCEKISSVIVCLIYILFPLDFIPDFIPVVGWIDDVGVSVLLLFYFSWRLEKVRQKSRQHARTDSGNDVIEPEIVGLDQTPFQLESTGNQREFFTENSPKGRDGK